MFACEIPHNMQRASARIARIICALLIVCIAPSSRGSAQIQKTVDEPHAAPPDRALLVFDRPRHRQASETTFRVVNEAGGCIASLENGWQVAAPMWPGKHMLLVVTGTAPPSVQLLQAKLSAGKTYVVRLHPRVNVKSPVRIEIVRKADQPLEQFPSVIKEQSPFKQDPRKCTE